MKKIFLVLVIVALGWVQIVQAQSTPAASEKKIYKNVEHAFSLVYPATWTEKKADPPNVVMLMTPASNASDPYYENVAVGIEVMPYAASLDEYTTAAVGYLKKDAATTILSEGKMQLGTIPSNTVVVSRKLNDQITLTQRNFIVVKDKKAYFLICSAVTAEDAAFLPLCETAVKSFRFE